jgi:hypothetical protein
MPGSRFSVPTSFPTWLTFRSPAEYVVSLAARHATRQLLPSKTFNGGSETNAFLRNLGFEITTKEKQPVAAERQGEKEAVIARPASRKGTTGWHNWRRDLNFQFRALAAARRPLEVLHHPHTTTKCWTWESKWQKLRAELPCVEDYLGTGAYSFRDAGWDQRDSLARVLDANRQGATLDVIVRLASSPGTSACPSSDRIHRGPVKLLEADRQLPFDFRFRRVREWTGERSPIKIGSPA